MDHDIALCSTQQISDALNKSKMGASVVGKAWGGAPAAGDGESKTGGGQRRGRGVAKAAAVVTGVKQSRIHIGLICCASEVKMVEKVVLPLPGVKDIKVNILTKTACKDESFSRCWNTSTGHTYPSPSATLRNMYPAHPPPSFLYSP